MNERILVVDDERSLREFLTILLEDEGFTVDAAATVGEARAKLADGRFDLVICDLKLPDGNGMEVLSSARSTGITTPFVVITAHTTPQHALEALRAGAAEYLSKPFEVEELKLIIARVLGQRTVAERGAEMDEFVGSSPAISRILELVPRIASSPSTVLITGESGTGKELLARAIHSNSPRAEGPFLTVNCGALPEGLLESELFGHVRGAFTGAVRDHAGLTTRAQGGTLFLDEIGELTPPVQVKLLRVLQDHRVRPVGGTTETQVDVRFLAATNRDLVRDVEDGRFREDLFYRLNVIHLHVPPLRERPQDVPDLARHIVGRTCRRLGIGEKRLTADAVQLLQAYRWPGNVRELENVLERTVVLESSDVITSGSLRDRIHGQLTSGPADPISLPEDGVDLEELLEGVRRSLMRQALEHSRGNQRRAARLLRMSYRSFRYHADKLGLRPASEDSS